MKKYRITRQKNDPYIKEDARKDIEELIRKVASGEWKPSTIIKENGKRKKTIRNKGEATISESGL